MPFHGKPSDDRHAAIRELDPRPWYKDAAKGENVTEILYYTEKTILLLYPTGNANVPSGSLQQLSASQKVAKNQVNNSGNRTTYAVSKNTRTRTSHPCERRARDRKAFC
jgi:hypothetical protein